MRMHKYAETPVVAVFALDGEVQLYAETLRYMAWRLAGSGARVVRFGCSGSLEACTSVNSTDKNALIRLGKLPVCSRCKEAQRNIQADAVFEVQPVDLPILPTEAEFLVELHARLQVSRRIETILDMTYDEVEVTRIAFFDFAIVTKLSHQSSLDDIALTRFIAGVKDLLVLLKALKRLCEANQISHVLYVNGNYSQNTLVRVFSAKRGIECLSVEPQLTSQKVLNRVLLAKDRLVLEPEGLQRFPSGSEDMSISSQSILDVLANFGARIDGGDFNAYTSLAHSEASTSELQRLNMFLQKFSRTHAVFLSSEDELLPHILTHGALNGGDLESPGHYPSQAEFVRSLLLDAESHPQIGFVIRLHPRMAANKRENFESEEHIKYKQMLAGMTIPHNVFVLYGDSKVSSYYVVSKVNLVIIAWSTIGLEALLLGTPVVSVFPSCLMYPLPALSNQPKSGAELRAALFEVTDYGVANDELLLRWLARGYEGQFFSTAAPRSKGGLLGKIYRLCYRQLSRYGFYGVMARLISSLPSARVDLDPRRLMLAQRPTETVGHTAVKIAIAKYREKYLPTLVAYGQGRSL